MPEQPEKAKTKSLYITVALIIALAVALSYVSYRWRQTDNKLKQTSDRLKSTQQRLAQANYGDLNHDGRVSVSDLVILSSHYGKKDPAAP